MTKAIVMAWHDSKRDEYRALVDEIDADGGRHPAGAARGETAERCGAWITAILLDLGAKDEDVQTINVGTVEGASFLTIRAMALVAEAKAIGI
jgi:hypothetical protein